MIEKTTANKNYPKPDRKNFLQDDVGNIESALDMIDQDIHTLKQGHDTQGQDIRTLQQGQADNAQAIAAYGMPVGGIVMWSGAADNIPQGWALCDGTNSTPDLRDRFIVGAGNTYNPETTGGEATVTLTTDQMPSHTHTATQPEHNHNNGDYKYLLKIDGADSTDGVNDVGATQPNLVSGGEMLAAEPGITVDDTGGGQPHENMPPYYALCFIIKL